MAIAVVGLTAGCGGTGGGPSASVPASTRMADLRLAISRPARSAAATATSLSIVVQQGSVTGPVVAQSTVSLASLPQTVDLTVPVGTVAVTAELLNGTNVVAGPQTQTVTIVAGATNSVAFNLSGSSSTFASPVSFPAGEAPSTLAFEDVNRDGKPDVIVGDSQSFGVLLSTTPALATAATFGSIQEFPTSGVLGGPVYTADFNDDHQDDVFQVNNSNGPGTVSVNLNATTAASTTAQFLSAQTFATNDSPFYAVVADFNGDGSPDAAVEDFFSNDVIVYTNTTPTGSGTVTFNTTTLSDIGSNPQGIVVADVNGDHLPDIIVSNQGDNTISVMLNNTTPGSDTATFLPPITFAVGSPTTRNGASPVGIVAADFNGDGKPDVAVAVSGSTSVSILLNTTPPGSEGPSFGPSFPVFSGGNSLGLAAGDLDGDTRPDLLVADEANNVVQVLHNTTAAGASTPSFTALTPVPLTGVFNVAAEDINQDGLLDIVAVSISQQSVSVVLQTP